MSDRPVSETGERGDDLFRRVLASMNAGRSRPIPESEHQNIRALCHEAIRFEYDLKELGDG